MIECLGSYKILDRIGDGGIGEVFRARDTRAGRTVAIKVIARIIADDAARRGDLLRDAQTAAALSHPNIAALYEIAEDQGELFLVFEFVPGEPLKAAIAGRPLNSRRAIHLAVQIADALAAAHAHGIIDGGLTPDRIFVTPKGNAKILDLGLGAWTTSGRARAAAVAGAAPAPIAAIAAYMSPEQVAGGPTDHRSESVFARCRPVRNAERPAAVCRGHPGGPPDRQRAVAVGHAAHDDQPATAGARSHTVEGAGTVRRRSIRVRSDDGVRAPDRRRNSRSPQRRERVAGGARMQC